MRRLEKVGQTKSRFLVSLVAASAAAVARFVWPANKRLDNGAGPMVMACGGFGPVGPLASKKWAHVLAPNDLIFSSVARVNRGRLQQEKRTLCGFSGKVGAYLAPLSDHAKFEFNSTLQVLLGLWRWL